MKKQIIALNQVNKSFEVDTGLIPVLKDVSFTVQEGDFVIIVGPSGCGKSTLLHIMLGLEIPTTGTVRILDKDIYTSEKGTLFDEDTRSDFRKSHMGMIYQQPQWIRSFSVIKNIEIVPLLRGLDVMQSLDLSLKALDDVSMMNWANYYPMQLSSGQQQKVALARSIVTDPDILVADEPTGNLDYTSGTELMKLLKSLNDKGKTILMVTHDLEYLDYATMVVHMFDGAIKKIENK